MLGFTELETAVLHAVFAETPQVQGALERQLEAAKVVERANSGAGFFTTIAVPPNVPPVTIRSPLETDIHATVGGLDQPMGFVVFMKDGRLETLEGFTYGAVSTVDLDFERLNFEVMKLPVTRV